MQFETRTNVLIFDWKENEAPNGICFMPPLMYEFHNPAHCTPTYVIPCSAARESRGFAKRCFR